MMDLASTYDISRTSEFIRGGNFSRVALQFPDELLKDSPWVAKALREEVGRSGVRFYVMADTAYGSCCVDEVAASHVDADCVVHYGHACMTPTTTLPALYVFGKECIDINACLEAMHQCLSATKKPLLVLFGLEYAHAISTIKSLVTADSSRLGDLCQRLHFANITCDSMMPSGIHWTDKEVNSVDGVCLNGELHKHADDRCNLQGNTHLSNYSLGGLTCRLPEDMKIEDCKLFWIGLDNSAYANVVLTFNSCDIVRFDARENCLVEDTSHLKRILKRRYYLVEKAKDANIVGVLIGTLGLGKTPAPWYWES